MVETGRCSISKGTELESEPAKFSSNEPKVRLLQSVKPKETMSKRFKCSFLNCMKTYSSKGNMKTHYSSVHMKKKFPCTFAKCNESYSTKLRLDIHTRTHVK